VKPALRVPVEGVADGVRELPPDAAAYATRVHRLAVGDPLVLFDPEAAVEAEAVILEVARRSVTVRVATPRAAQRRPSRAVTLLQGVGKGDKIDAIVRDATELGATRVVPVLCERSVALPGAARALRWRRVAVEAARQCGRGDAPAIGAPISFTDALREEALRASGARRGGGAAVRVCLDPGADSPLASAFGALAGQAVIVAVGPEGGFTKAELALADAGGFRRVTLGPLVLRTETVCAAVLGALLAWPQRAEA
jgi:16S rRNA (uracil1498-N3)-methyltransferase